jgi:hypothetical protein
MMNQLVELQRVQQQQFMQLMIWGSSRSKVHLWWSYWTS